MLIPDIFLEYISEKSKIHQLDSLNIISFVKFNLKSLNCLMYGTKTKCFNRR